MFETSHSSVVEQRTVELRGYPWVVGSIPTGVEFLLIVSSLLKGPNNTKYKDMGTIWLHFWLRTAQFLKFKFLYL